MSVLTESGDHNAPLQKYSRSVFLVKRVLPQFIAQRLNTQ